MGVPLRITVAYIQEAIENKQIILSNGNYELKWEAKMCYSQDGKIFLVCSEFSKLIK
jgi:hypothetical protein